MTSDRISDIIVDKKNFQEDRMSRKEIIAGISVFVATIIIVAAGIALYSNKPAAGKGSAVSGSIEYWTEGSAPAQSIIDFVAAVSDKDSGRYIPPEKRIAVFDVDGTLIGELFPTYFDQCLMMYRLLHDDKCTYQAPQEDIEFVKALEYALLHGEKEPDSPRSTAQITAESFKGCTVDEYRAYICDFMTKPVNGFEGMTYGEAFYKPMVGLVKYLSEHDFQVFIVSGGERIMLQELLRDTLGKWVPSSRMIGSIAALAATGQGDTAARNYTYTAEDNVIMDGNITFKDVKMNKVVSIVNEIGEYPVLAFGNSSGDLAMGQYTVQHGGQAYMLLCDDTERDYGRPDVAEKFRADCDMPGFYTVSMKNDFATIYGDNVVKTSFSEELVPAA